VSLNADGMTEDRIEGSEYEFSGLGRAAQQNVLKMLLRAHWAAGTTQPG
jgi:hypothetical protein